MSLSELCWQDAATLGSMIRRREVSPVEVAQAHLDRIAETNGELNAFLHVCAEAALLEARQAEAEIGAGNYRGPLHGLPVAYKDVYHVKGLPTTAHSRVMSGFVAKRDSEVAARLRRSGAVTLGKLNTTEFASGGMELFGIARNPWDTDRSAGNSSSGAGVALAAGMTPLAIGSDTGGSTRIPAAFCGVVGLKPTLGRISCAGMLAVSSEMDCVGPMARTAADTALLLQALAGRDPGDAVTSDAPVPDYSAPLANGPSLAGLRLGVPRAYFFDQIDPEIATAVDAAVDALRDLGATVHPVDLPSAEYGFAAHWCITFSEAYPRHRDRFFARREDIGNVYVRKISTWPFITGEELVIAWKLRRVIREEMRAVFERVDVLVTPTTPMTAPLVDDFVGTQADTSRLTRITAVAGLPAVAVPCGFTPGGLPTSFQLTGGPWSEPTLLRIAHVYAMKTALHTGRRPPLRAGAGHRPANRSEPMTGGGVHSAPPAATPTEDWMRAYAKLIGLTYLKPDDFAPMAAQLAPVKAQLAKARHFLSGPYEVERNPNE